MTFTHLHVKSGYTLMESTITIDRLVERAKKLQFSTLALTDHHVMYGAIEFYKACERANIKPILGMTVTVADELYDGNIVLLAKNNAGYQQLMQLSTYIQTNDCSAVEIADLKHNVIDVVCILQLRHSSFVQLLIEEKVDQFKDVMKKWKSIFSDIYIGVEDDHLMNKQPIDRLLQSLMNKKIVQVVAINDVTYVDEKDWLAYDCLQSMKAGKRWSPEATKGVPRRFLRSSEQMVRAFSHLMPEAVEATEEIAAQCDVTFDFTKRILPSFPVPKGYDAHTYLASICWENVERLYDPVTDEVKERLTYELDVIESLDFSHYFLIVWDFVKYAREQNIFVGPGRGSAAGSLVAYILRITNVDPLAYGLLFERFLNPERESMPDIDIDFSDHRRDEVIDYVRRKYGDAHVAQIITFGTFGTRSVLRELFKTIGIDQQHMYFILNYIPAQANKPLINYIEKSPELRQYIKQSDDLRLLFKVALTLEGLPRHISTHAAGVVITDERLDKHIPLTIGSNEMTMTQYPMDDLEALGLLKMDFLGLRNLTMIERIIDSINYQERVNKLSVNSELPENDQLTYELLEQGRTDGVFQLESSGMKDVLQRMKPKNLEDIVAVNALYRPGPMDEIDSFIKRKHGERQVNYIHPELAPILQDTYGVLLYQEQMMEIVHHFTNYTLGQADIVRRIISEKDPEKIKRTKEDFITRAMEKNYGRQEMERLFNWLVKFSDYGFNRSHAVAYSKISYQLAYLKAHYPAHFYAQLFTSVANRPNKIAEYMADMRKMDIQLKQPSINRSIGMFTVEKGNIRIGLLAVKGIGFKAVREIISVRKEKPFSSIFDFCLRVSLDIVNRSTIERLILVGAFDEFGQNRASLLATLDQAIDQGKLFREYQGQTNLLEENLTFKQSYVELEDIPILEKLNAEKQYLGIYVSSHPIKSYRASLERANYVTLAEASERLEQNNLQAVAIVQSIKKIRTRRGEPMAFLQLSDETADLDAVIFPKVFRRAEKWLKEEIIVNLVGRTEQRRNKVQWIVNDIKLFSNIEVETSDQRLFVKIEADSYRKALNDIQQLTKPYPGPVPIYIHLAKEGKTYKLDSSYNVQPDEYCLQQLRRSFGADNVVLTK